MNVGILDHSGLVALFRKLEGRRFVGAVDCGDCVEVVFEDSGGGNLVTVFTDAGRHTGRIALGGVAEPDSYVAGWREWEHEAA